MAYLDDRIWASEAKPQRFGTQFDMTPHGPVMCEVEAPERLDEHWRSVGLDPVARQKEALAREPRPSQAAYLSRKAAESAWRYIVGWRRQTEL